ncbi:hypothetical protein FG064_16260 [Vibrio cholerae]|nr:hypothetical protein [Vibrio cholerae]
MNWIYLLAMSTVGVIPSLVSIRYLLPNATWHTRITVLVSRGLIKIPFGILFGFLGVIFIQLSTRLAQVSILWSLTPALVYLSLIWLYLFTYKLMLNTFFKLDISWKAIINSIAIELGLLALVMTIAVSIAIAFNL